METLVLLVCLVCGFGFPGLMALPFLWLSLSCYVNMRLKISLKSSPGRCPEGARRVPGGYLEGPGDSLELPGAPGGFPGRLQAGLGQLEDDSWVPPGTPKLIEKSTFLKSETPMAEFW